MRELLMVHGYFNDFYISKPLLHKINLSLAPLFHIPLGLPVATKYRVSNTLLKY